MLSGLSFDLGNVLFWRRSRLDSVLAFAVLALTSIVVFTGYSGSPKAGFILSIIKFIVMHIRYVRWLWVWQGLMCFYIFGLPFVWIAQPSSWLRFLASTGNDHINDRISIYNFTVGAILEHWFVGYGFGGASLVLAQLPVPNGGHPHNIVFLFWLEFGVFGAFLLALGTMVLVSFIHHRTAGRRNEPIA